MLSNVTNCFFQIKRVRRITKEDRFNQILLILDRQENPVHLCSGNHQK